MSATDSFNEAEAEQHIEALGTNTSVRDKQFFVIGARWKHKQLDEARKEIDREKELNNKILEKLAKKHVYVYRENIRLTSELVTVNVLLEKALDILFFYAGEGNWHESESFNERMRITNIDGRTIKGDRIVGGKAAFNVLKEIERHRVGNGKNDKV